IDENVGAHFKVERTIIFSKKYVRVLYMSFHSYRVVFCAPIPTGLRTPDFGSYRVVFCAPIPTGPRTPNFGSCSMSYSLQTVRGRYSGLSGPVYRPKGMSTR